MAGIAPNAPTRASSGPPIRIALSITMLLSETLTSSRKVDENVSATRTAATTATAAIMFTRGIAQATITSAAAAVLAVYAMRLTRTGDTPSPFPFAVERAMGGGGRTNCSETVQRSQVALAPLDSTKAARLAMARKILFDMCTPPSSIETGGAPPLVGTRLVRSARWSPWDGVVHPPPRGVMDTGGHASDPHGSRAHPSSCWVTSPAHRSLCSCQLAAPHGHLEPSSIGECPPMYCMRS
jgi:hypothetical protein